MRFSVFPHLCWEEGTEYERRLESMEMPGPFDHRRFKFILNDWTPVPLSDLCLCWRHILIHFERERHRGKNWMVVDQRKEMGYWEKSKRGEQEQFKVDGQKIKSMLVRRKRAYLCEANRNTLNQFHLQPLLFCCRCWVILVSSWKTC